jgi:carbonic anhydrase/acetyltransferase-like protein (isoleucine patch superfamily)
MTNVNPGFEYCHSAFRLSGNFPYFVFNTILFSRIAKYSVNQPRITRIFTEKSVKIRGFIQKCTVTKFCRIKHHKSNMALIKSVRGFTPQFGDDCYFADNATVIGDVVMGRQCSVWFQAVLRGDVNAIRIGDKVNVQDGVIIHGTYERASTTIGHNVSIGHRAIVHGCTLYDNVLVGMGAIIMDHAVVESNVLIAAGAVVLERSRLEKGNIYAGVPARKVKAISEEQFTDSIERIANAYVKYAGWY